ncbi:hypothetical protein FNL55_03195 [Tardiphaga sp. vice352]|uniref:hypothetical protein n=1 Tax=unclassified Tardiphaga TaxID=2631404 RepID=UPI0011654A5B|nr:MULTISPECIES: hypothetical protein [unclassified Tardiphaga]QDM15063.1 hypothetical protein FNL53_03145 [Tardiphaga sp. vice278]QDM20176.1 hypothetical protein FIU28_02640 [Tardiphaga sp. vice154]QDM25252.1 hypothetical protein FNL56_03115 [Tardiphaga sp. vice304]QDM30460.1 hypothetical protein FNL55_03195 [Tardiphaga sp. vice352]
MTLEEFLCLHLIDLGALVEGAQAVASIGEDDVLLAVGSLAEGLGTTKSDVDLILITPREELARVSPDEVVSWVSGTCIIDMRILPRTQVVSIIDRIESWSRSAWNVTRAADFTANELLLLHRLYAGTLLWPRDAEADHVSSSRPACANIARLKLHVARHMARTIQVDMVGYRDAGDHRSMVFAAQELLGHAVDGFLAGFHLTNPTPKWRSRLLERLPVDWGERLMLRPTGLSASELVWQLHRAPAAPTKKLALDHACRIATFARSAFTWAECELIGGAETKFDRYKWPASVRRGGTPLPNLELDVDFCLMEDGVAVARLNELGASLKLSFAEFAMMLLFDNTTTSHEAAIVGDSVNGVGFGLRTVERMADQVEQSGFVIAR